MNISSLNTLNSKIYRNQHQPVIRVTTAAAQEFYKSPQVASSGARFGTKITPNNYVRFGEIGAVKELEELKKLWRANTLLGGVRALLSWDQETYMPKGAAEGRAEQQALLAGISHERKTAKRIGELLEALQKADVFDTLSQRDQRLVKEAQKEYNKVTKLPQALVEDLAKTGSQAHEAWAKAREESNFATFQPLLAKMIDLQKQVARILDPNPDAPNQDNRIYDIMLDEYEPGLTMKDVDKVFTELRDGLVPLVRAIKESPNQPDRSVIEKEVDPTVQAKFSKLLMEAIGFNTSEGRLDTVLHPFCTTIGPGDVRLTTRYLKQDFMSSAFGTLHEAGHGKYEQGLPATLFGTPLGEAASTGIHESQSRFWENLVGRSKAFWRFMFPKAKEILPKELDGVTEEQLYKAVNVAKPSLIRVEADEVTYNLHIMVRYEIEKDLIAGKIKVEDLPKIWNEKMQAYLGVTPPNDAQGVLQDIHWSMGGFGYFPTYALGNLYSAQLYVAAKRDIPDLEQQIERGDFTAINAWLKNNIHEYAKTETPAEILQRVTGEPLNAKYFLDYLWSKYGEIYGIQRPATGESATAAVTAS